MSHLDNIEIFEDTVDFCTRTPELIESITQSRKNQVLTFEKDNVPDGSKVKTLSGACKNCSLEKTHF